VVLGEKKPFPGKNIFHTLPVQPRRRDKAVDTAAESVLHHPPPLPDPPAGFLRAEGEKLSFAGCHVPRPPTCPGGFPPAVVKVAKTVEEHLDSAVGKGPQPFREFRMGGKLLLAVKIRNDQHGVPPSHTEAPEGLVDALEALAMARARVVDGDMDQSLTGTARGCGL
jgi:hypothetical protein